ncbi:MAG: hypothetical protein DBX45_08345 [Oscillospiraceae bacterium]|jgi:hypothetical protein|nr:MAG: hypothetical protein DBX45_08345 [Oscillospiraceae bacterium]
MLTALNEQKRRQPMPPEYNLSGGEGIDEEHVPSAKNIAHHRQAISSRSMQYSMDMLHNRMIDN